MRHHLSAAAIAAVIITAGFAGGVAGSASAEPQPESLRLPTATRGDDLLALRHMHPRWPANAAVIDGELRGKVTIKQGDIALGVVFVYTRMRPLPDSAKVWAPVAGGKIKPSGKWVIRDAPAGRYTVIFAVGDEKEHLHGLQFAGGKAAPWQGETIEISKKHNTADFGTEKLGAAKQKVVWDGTDATIEGTPKVGKTLTAEPHGLMKNTVTKYFWGSVNGNDIIEGRKYEVKKRDLAGDLVPLFTPWKKGFVSPALTSALVTAGAPVHVKGYELAAGTPTIIGTGAANAELSVDLDETNWTENTTFAYQWYADGAPISAANGATFTPDATYEGKTITVEVTGSKKYYEPESRTTPGVTIAPAG